MIGGDRGSLGNAILQIPIMLLYETSLSAVLAAETASFAAVISAGSAVPFEDSWQSSQRATVNRSEIEGDIQANCLICQLRCGFVL